MTALRGVCAALAAIAVASCVPCPEEDVFESTATGCDESFCGDPSVEVGVGAVEHEPAPDGAPVELVFGPQGGYHIDMSATMEQLCPIVRLRFSVEVVLSDGTRQELSAGEQRVQAVRDGSRGSVQDYWGLAGLIPCDWYPDGPHLDQPNPPDCPDGTGTSGKIDEHDVVLIVEAEDDNGRVGRGEVIVTPSCCAE